MSQRLMLNAIFHAEREGGYTATVANLPVVVSYGATIEEAQRNIVEAVQLHAENLKAHSQLSDENV